MSLLLLFLVIAISRCDIKRTPPPVLSDGDFEVSYSEPSGENVIPDGDLKRYAWQKPNLVISELGNIKEKVIADIGAGTGYFTFRLIPNAKEVIAIDINQDMLDLIDLFRENLDSLAQSKVVTRLAEPDDPKLLEDEVDVVMIINTIGFIEDRISYLDNLHKALKPGGLLFIVDYKMKRLPGDIIAPSEYRVSLLELEEELRASKYSAITADDTSLDYQYIVKAYNLETE